MICTYTDEESNNLSLLSYPEFTRPIVGDEISSIDGLDVWIVRKVRVVQIERDVGFNVTCLNSKRARTRR